MVPGTPFPKTRAMYGNGQLSADVLAKVGQHSFEKISYGGAKLQSAGMSQFALSRGGNWG